MLTPPTRASSVSKLMPWRRANQSMIRRTSAMTSGPMPSPGSSRTVPSGAGSLRSIAITRPRGTARAARRAGRLRRRRSSRLFCMVRPTSSRPCSRQCLRNGIDFEGEHLVAGRAADLLLVQIHGEGRVLRLARLARQDIDLLLRQDNRQNAVLEAIVEEDVGERRGDHAADAEVEQRPRRMLARAAAAEVLAGDQDLRLRDRARG